MSQRTTMSTIDTGEQMKTKWIYSRSRRRSRDGLETTPLSEHGQIVFEYRELLLDSVQ
jgi:hypothetical protein